MSFNSWWSRSLRGRHKDRRRSKWLRHRSNAEQTLEVDQDRLDRLQRTEDQPKRN